MIKPGRFQFGLGTAMLFVFLLAALLNLANGIRNPWYYAGVIQIEDSPKFFQTKDKYFLRFAWTEGRGNSLILMDGANTVFEIFPRGVGKSSKKFREAWFDMDDSVIIEGDSNKKAEIWKRHPKFLYSLIALFLVVATVVSVLFSGLRTEK